MATLFFSLSGAQWDLVEILATSSRAPRMQDLPNRLRGAVHVLRVRGVAELAGDRVRLTTLGRRVAAEMPNDQENRPAASG